MWIKVFSLWVVIFGAGAGAGGGPPKTVYQMIASVTCCKLISQGGFNANITHVHNFTDIILPQTRVYPIPLIVFIWIQRLPFLGYPIIINAAKSATVASYQKVNRLPFSTEILDL